MDEFIEWYCSEPGFHSTGSWCYVTACT
jgi:hypothetical protein